MRKYISKIAVVFLMAFVIGIGYGVSAKAADDYEVGTTNLNGTVGNSAKVGNQISKPEKGWKRYDDTNGNITYDGPWFHKLDLFSAYNKATTWNPNGDGTIKFNFVGSKIRLLTMDTQDRNLENIIKIDGVVYKFKGGYLNGYQVLLFEKIDMEFKEHRVEIQNAPGKYFDFDAIDIDANGQLKPYEKVNEGLLTLDKNSLSLLVEKSEKITATVTPDNIKDKKIIWSTSDKSIAAVDENGNVRALKEGNAVITATVEGTDLKAECKVTVTKKDVPVEPSQGDAVLTITMTNGNIKSYNVTMEKVNDFIKWYEGRANGSNGTPFYKFDKSINEDKIITEYIVFDKISSFQVEQNK